jgi:hypothetical protein
MVQAVITINAPASKAGSAYPQLAQPCASIHPIQSKAILPPEVLISKFQSVFCDLSKQ